MQLEISSWDVEISSSNSKYPVRQSRNFQFELEISSWDCRNFQFEEVEISSSNSKYPVGQSGNFQFELEISSCIVEISSLKKSKFPVWRSRNFQFELEISSSDLEISSFDIPTGNFDFKLEISISANWKFRVQTRNFELHFRLECGTNTLSHLLSFHPPVIKNSTRENVFFCYYIFSNVQANSNSTNIRFIHIPCELWCRRYSPAVACFTSDQCVAGKNPLRAYFIINFTSLSPALEHRGQTWLVDKYKI